MFCLDEDGVTFVVRAGDRFELLHTNKLADDDMCMASPALAGDRLLICGRCTARWTFDPVACPFCRNDDRGLLPSFTSRDRLLIATPVARVALTLVAFVLQRDRVYVGLTGLVLILLTYGLLWSR